MQAIREQDDPAFFRFVSDGNLLRQYDFLRATVEIALKNPDKAISHDVVRQLNNHAVVFLCETPGMYRKQPIYINNSSHRPPPHEQVDGLMDECLLYLAESWKRCSATHLAAYALWRLNWIHPFVEGNGRTARATSYLVLCAKHKMWLPGSNIIPKQIRENRDPYYAALRMADQRFEKDGTIDVSALESYLDQLLTNQLAS